jgi:hypothetical protein
VPAFCTSTAILASVPTTRRAVPVNDNCSSIPRLVAPSRRSVVWLFALVSVTSDPFANQRASAI